MASAYQELLISACSATVPNDLCCGGACGSEGLCYDWTEGLDWLFEMVSDVLGDMAHSTAIDDKLQIHDNEEGADQIATAEPVPMDYEYHTVMDVNGNVYPSVLPSLSPSHDPSTIASPTADSVPVLPPFSNLPSTNHRSVSTQKTADINGNSISVPAPLPTHHSLATELPDNQPILTSVEHTPAASTPHRFNNVLEAANYSPPRTRSLRKHPNTRFDHRDKNQSLCRQFPDLKASLMDFLAKLIRDAKFGNDEIQSVAQKDLESITTSAIQRRLMETVPGLAARGISHTSIHRFLRPLTIRNIRKCLKDRSAWRTVNDVLAI